MGLTDGQEPNDERFSFLDIDRDFLADVLAIEEYVCRQDARIGVGLRVGRVFLIDLGIEQIREGVAAVRLAIDQAANFFDGLVEISGRLAFAGATRDRFAIFEDPLLQAWRPAARRLPVGNLINRAIGIVIVLAALGPIGRFMVVLEGDGARAVADFHTAFNLMLALVFFPLLRPYAALLRRILPTQVNQGDPARPVYLDPAARETPVVAIGAAAREALRLADVLDTMLIGVPTNYAIRVY
jgi:hypothetical protein